MRRFMLFISLLLLTVPCSFVFAQDDGIPDNCEYQYADYYRPTLFPRYEPQNRRLLLVDWTTGAEVAVLGTELDDTLIRAWSVNCRYLAVATGSAESRDTVVYDTVDMRQVGSVPDARGAAHPITWGPGEFLVVEGRKAPFCGMSLPISSTRWQSASTRRRTAISAVYVGTKTTIS